MKRWWLPILLLVLGTCLAGLAGWGANAGLGAAIGLGEGETLSRVRLGGGGAPATGDAAADGADEAGDTGADDTPASAAPVAARDDAPRRGLPRKAYIDGIMARNIFDSEAIGKAKEAPEACEGDDCEFEASDLPVKLLATVVAVPEEYSSALLFEENRKRAGGYGIGDKILDATITRIEDKRVIVLRGDGREQYLVPSDEDSPTTGGTIDTSDAVDVDEGITKVGDNEYVLDRNMVDAALGDLDALSRMARARPHKDRDGNIDGFRLSGVRRNKLGYKIGIRSGDVVHSVNGRPLTSLQEAMGAMETLRNGSNFEFEITRRGRKETLKYQVR